MDTNIAFERLFNYYKVSTIRDLAEKLNMSESTVSKWRQRDSLNAIKKKCREIGIYSEIFGDLNSKINVNTNTGQVSSTVQGNQTQNNNTKQDEYIIPGTILDDINILFKLAVENEKEDDLIDLIDEFIFNTKKELRKK
ncbi:helix-turn-helix domain-containing protein [Aliarcobacter cryaerophilus]|uniref:Helix-turn-helix domain-containing protein n=1 Tax=Aliarcobacter cryaerophilus TaxID=28198 RepID=A0A7G9LMB6_9BACT|nr:helix-turn-helix domain-containing protein [Aliarcobacter cryaerophilus]QNM89765.1 helix-turn-helix domain-containing protein [Aliarcobacter cryaerophilus]